VAAKFSVTVPEGSSPPASVTNTAIWSGDGCGSSNSGGGGGDEASTPDIALQTCNTNTTTTTVTKAVLTVTASNITYQYGSTPPTVSPQYAGFVGTDTVSSLTTAATCVTTNTPHSPVGATPGADTCSGAVDPNYTINYVAGSASVTPAPLTITASSPSSQTVDTAIPAITPSYSGFVNGDTASSLTTAPTCSTAATTASPAGTYATNCSGAADPNYTITYVPGTLVLTAVPVSSPATPAAPAATPRRQHLRP
jgi:hypothetical protein